MPTKGVFKVSEQENKELVKKGYDAFAAGDVQAVMDLFDDDVEWVQPGESAISGTFHGKTEVMEFLGRLAEKGPTVTVKRLIAEGDTVVAVTEVSVDGQSGEDGGARRHRATRAGLRQEGARHRLTAKSMSDRRRHPMVAPAFRSTDAL
jgi:ketosteroid isomerase-like protein